MRKVLAGIHEYRNLTLALFLIRLWLGTIMIKHSTSYLFGGKMMEFTTYLSELGFPFPELMAYASQVVELITAIMILAGLRIGAIILALNMSVALAFAHQFRIYEDGELAFNYFTFAVLISILGCGKWSLDNLIFAKTNNEHRL